MGLQVPIGGVESLPDAVQVRFAIRSSRRLVDIALARCWCCTDLESGDHGDRSARRYCASSPISHVRLLSNPACPAGATAVCLDADTVATDAPPRGDVGYKRNVTSLPVISPSSRIADEGASSSGSGGC